MEKMHIKLGDRSYNIIVGYNNLALLGKHIKRLNIGADAVIITNPKVKKLYGEKTRRSLVKQGISVRFEEVPDRESSKSNACVYKLLKRIASYDVKKRLFIVALGGGVVGDLAGFIAAIYKRGIPCVQVPTTLLAQVDAAIGGKTGIDLPQGKNLVGAFWQPRLVFSDISVLKTLKMRELRCGLAEVVKYGVILDARLFKFLEGNIRKVLKVDRRALQYIVAACSRLKARIVERDERETRGERTILNYGHTVGHAVEAAINYSNLYKHGEAISIGMVCAFSIAQKLGMASRKDLLRLERLLSALGLPTKIRGVNLNRVLQAKEHDKKFIHAKNRLVLPRRIGTVIVREGIPARVIERALREVCIK